MRKALIAVAVATALFAVGAFAASFAVQSEDIASGSDPVEACASNVDITFDTPVLTGGVWTVSQATATFYDTSPATPSTACDSFDAQIAVDVNGVLEDYADPTISGGVATFTFDAPIAVEDVDAASVVVDGAFIPAP